MAGYNPLGEVVQSIQNFTDGVQTASSNKITDLGRQWELKLSLQAVPVDIGGPPSSSCSFPELNSVEHIL